MYNVKKRDGKVVKFELGKIKDALSKAIEATEQPVDEDVVDFMALKVTSDFASKVKDDIIGVEDIQDSCEAVLGKSGSSILLIYKFVNSYSSSISVRSSFLSRRQMSYALRQPRNVISAPCAKIPKLFVAPLFTMSPPSSR